MAESRKAPARTRRAFAPIERVEPSDRKPDQKTPDQKTGAYSIEVLRRSINVLGVFTDSRPTMALREIVALTGMPKTTVFRILTTLVELEFCEIDPHTGDYSLGFALLRLADVRRRQGNVHTIALPVMRELRNAVNETVVLSVQSGDGRVHIDVVESLQPVRRTADIGVSAPLYVGAASKVLLAGMNDADIEAYLARTPLKAFQHTTITSADALWREIRLIRRRGYAESKGELVSGGGALAAPLKDYSGRTVAVLDILTPESRYTSEHRETCIRLLLAGVRQVSERLGLRGD